ncbi:MAG: ester cyclase [Henriciella sp.]
MTDTVFGSAEANPNELVDIAEFANFGNLIFGSMDYDGDTAITFEEFTTFDFGYKFLASEAGQSAAYLAAQRVVFSFWDRNANDEISATEWRSAMNADFQRADRDSNALLSRDEFSKFYVVNQAYTAALSGNTSAPEPCSADMEAQNKAVIESFIRDGQSARDLDVVAQYLGDKFQDHSAPVGATSGSAREQSLAFHEALFTAFPDFRVEIHQQIAECDKVVTYKSFHGTHREALFGFTATNEPIKIDVIDILRVENGEVTDHWVVNNLQRALTQTN